MSVKKDEQINLTTLHEKIIELEERISSMESSIHSISHKPENLIHDSNSETDSSFDFKLPLKPKFTIEFGVGEYGMAWMGNIVLLFGIIFLTQNLHNSGKLLLSVIIGYFSVAAIYFASYYTKNAYSYLSRLLFFNGHIILYTITLQLYFFQENPVVGSPLIVLTLLYVISIFLLFKAYKNKSQFEFGFILLLLIGAAVISNSTHLLLATTLGTSVLSVLMYKQFNWIKLIFFCVTILYFVDLHWLLNNPIITKIPEFRAEQEFGVIYLIISAFIFSLLAMLPKKEDNSDELIISAIIWNGLGFTTVFVLTVITYFPNQYMIFCGFISLFCLLYAVLLKSKSATKIAASLYAIYGFIAMSVFIYGIFQLPNVFLFLAVQSLLVVTMALWFRSRFMIIANIFMFIILLILYMSQPLNDNYTNFTYALVAFITARVLNWKKERLNIKTEYIRNLYLISGLLMTLISFYYAMPKSLITVSWICTAIFFFVFGYIIKNIKYRWLAITMLIASTINLVFVDMKNMNISLRILVFLVLAVISIAVSIIYSKIVSIKKEILTHSEKKAI